VDESDDSCLPAVEEAGAGSAVASGVVGAGQPAAGLGQCAVAVGDECGPRPGAHGAGVSRVPVIVRMVTWWASTVMSVRFADAW
jgi:hypothetical protein